MPQMSPMMWSFIIMMMIYSLVMMTSNMNFMKTPLIKKNEFKKNTKKMMW